MSDMESCEAAMIRGGVLMKDGRPAGARLIEQDVLRVAIVEAGADGRFPDDFYNFTRAHIPENDHNFLDMAAKFPEDIQEIVQDAVGSWSSADVIFVDYRQGADIFIFSFSDPERGINGAATFPEHDSMYAEAGSSKSFVYININGERNQTREGMTGVIRYEIWHTFGVLHPYRSLDSVRPYPEDCLSGKFMHLVRSGDHIMSNGFFGRGVEPPSKPSWYDAGTRDLIRASDSPSESPSPGPAAAMHLRGSTLRP